MITSRALCLVLLAGLTAGIGVWWVDHWIETTEIPSLVVETGVEVLDREETLLRAYTVENGRWRLPVRLDAVDPGFIEMLITYEDRRFYSHHGIDPRAFVRAAWQAATSGRIVSGGSTLTMQVARLLEGSGTGAWPGKLRQIRLALALERRLSKDEILTLYLHLAPYGGNIEGLRAATLSWFGIEPGRLTAAQSALLVALPQAPSSRRPDRFPQAAEVARDRVLDRAVRFTSLTEAEVAWARSAPIPTQRRPFPTLAAHLADRMLSERPTQGTHRLTLDAALQARMEALTRRAVEGRAASLGAAIMVIDHRTGALLASVGSPEFADVARDGFVDMTTAIRSPGSTLKPLIYGLAFEAGLIHPQTLIVDRPTNFSGYRPRNFDNLFRGEVSVAAALQTSLNVPAVSLLEALGPARMISAMRRAGMEIELPDGNVGAGLAIALGGIGTRMEDLMRLYGALARGGTALPWHVRHDETVQAGQRVLGPVASWYLADVLADVPPPATAPRHDRLPYKTGTSYGHRDAWAFGFDGRHVVGVWMGRADGASVPGAFGADLAAPILFEAFAQLGVPITPVSGPPVGALTVAHSHLPQPLQRFGGSAADDAGPEIVFPPAGAALAHDPDMPLVARVAQGRAPYAWLWNGVPVATDSFETQITLENPGIGFGELMVIDALGRARRLQLEIAAP